MEKLSKHFSFCFDQAASNDQCTQIHAHVSVCVVISIYPLHMHIHTIYCAPCQHTSAQCTCVKHIIVVVLLLEYWKMVTYLDHQIWREENTPEYVYIRCRYKYQCRKGENILSALSYFMSKHIFHIYIFFNTISHSPLKYLMPFHN